MTTNFSWFKSQPVIINCAFCGQPHQQIEMVCFIDDNEKSTLICPQCYGHIGTCVLCQYKAECGFQNDHSEPQIVMQTIRQGMMTMQTQVKNPNLVQKHCVNCRCSYDNNNQPVCMKEENGINCSRFNMLK